MVETDYPTDQLPYRWSRICISNCHESSAKLKKITSACSSGVPRNFFSRGGFQQIQLRTEDRENGDLGAAAP